MDPFDFGPLRFEVEAPRSHRSGGLAGMGSVSDICRIPSGGVTHYLAAHDIPQPVRQGRTHPYPRILGYPPARGQLAWRAMTYTHRRRGGVAIVPLLVFGALLVHCGSQATPVIAGEDSGGDAIAACNNGLEGVDASVDAQLMCFPDRDGISDCPATIVATVDDKTFSKTVFATQNYSTVTFTLTNKGTKAHGFEVECTSTLPGYPDLAAGCPKVSCFPSDSTIAPLDPGQSKTIVFLTPIADGINFPVKSSEPADCDVPGLNGSITQWQLL